jgi:predicted dehydrogenase
MSIGFGLLGSGFMNHTYAECLAKHVPDAHLVAVALGSRAPSLAAEYGVPAEMSAEDLLRRPDVDAVIIATPHSTHRALTELAAAAGKHVYVEKPMAVTVDDCDAMIRACEAAGVALTVNKITRFRAAPLAAKRLIDDGAIGAVRLIRVTSSVVGYLPDEHGWVKNAGEGGAWLDMGVHLFDALRWFTGSEVDVVFARIRDFGGIDHLKRSGAAELEMRNGVIVQVMISFEMPPPGIGSQSQWLFIGASGMVDADSYGKVRLGTGDGWRDIYEMPSFDLNADVYSPIRLAAFAAQVTDFAGSIRDGRSPAVGGRDGRAAVEVVEAAARSAATGASVRLRAPATGRE